MEYRFSFMPYYLHLASFFVHGETFNRQEPMIFLQFASVAGCVRSFILVHWILVIFMLVHFDCIYTFDQI